MMGHPQAHEKAAHFQDLRPVDTGIDTTANDPALARIVTAWPNLAEPIGRAMMALLG
jgi:hypothetical protein